MKFLLIRMNKMNNYNLIKEPVEVKKFLNLIPELQLNECMTVALFVRKKYAKDYPELSLDNNDSCFDRTILGKSKKDRDSDFNANVYRSILRYDAPYGAYVDRKGNNLPEDVLALYMSVNPRSAIKGTKELIKDLTEECFLQTHRDVYVGNLVSRAKTKIQKNPSRKLIADIDIDIKDENVLNAFRKLVNDHDSEVATIETRGGYHILVDIQIMAEVNSKWFVDITNLARTFNDSVDKDVVEFKTDTLCPIVGTMQGGFLVKFI
jgi:hypothetical protein